MRRVGPVRVESNGSLQPKRSMSDRKASTASQFQEDAPDPCPPQTGYRISILKCLLFYLLAICTLGAGFLFAYWFRSKWIKLTCRKCQLDQAWCVIVKDQDGKECVEYTRELVGHEGRAEVEGSGSITCEKDPLIKPHAEKKSKPHIWVNILDARGRPSKYFTHRRLRYMYSDEEEKFVLLVGYDCNISCNAVHQMIAGGKGNNLGLSHSEHASKLLRYGPNSIDVPVKPYHLLFVEEVLHPFYIFQILCIVQWLNEQYYYYSGCIFVMSLLSVLASLYQTRKNMQQLHDMVKQSCTVNVNRENTELHGVSGESLVPGDVMVIPPSGMSMPCDAVLLTGTAIVNEASLTGESVPVMKTPLPQVEEAFNPDRHKRHTLFGGTHVIQTRFYSNTPVLAVVVRTGFSTSKGGMVRSILYPKPLNFKFYLDAIKFVLLLAIIALVGFCYTIIILQTRKYYLKETLLRAFDVITIVVPPALPAALTVGTVYALQRLKKQQIYCISPQRVNLCGKIKLVCFDKTGTLTEDSLDMASVICASGQRFHPPTSDPSSLLSCPLLYGMTTCHSLTLIDGKLQGDPLDVKMFNSTGWTLEEPGEDTSRFDMIIPTIVKPPLAGPGQDGVELGIMKQFTFSSELQRMSVLVKTLPSHDPKLFHVYVKGAPEKIRKLCRPETVPEDFFDVLSSFTQKGMRVLAVGHRTMDVAWHKADKVERDMVECDLEFSGLIIMKNSLKPETTPVISVLKNANIRTVMVTGDNLLTAVSVARECGMIEPDHQAIMVKADLDGAGSDVRLVYHLLGEGKDLAELLQSGQATPKAANDQFFPPPSVDSLNTYGEGSDGTRDTERVPFSLVIDGKSFELVRTHCAEILKKLLVKGTVFARMSPDQKAQLVTDLQGLGYGVGMCGDGANDCGALKAAHAGISLSEAEASVASPFTSKVPNITCVPKVIMEGRAALTTSFSVFKFMALYSLTQFMSAAILYAYESNLGDPQYLYIDLFLILSCAFVMGLTGPYPHLARRRPPGTLAGLNVFLPVMVHVILLVAFQIGGLFYLQSRPWYKPLKPDQHSQNIACSENTVVFQMSIFQYVSLAVTLSVGPPYRKPLYTNLLFVLCAGALFPFNAYLTLAPASWKWTAWLWGQLQIIPHPYLMFRVGLVELAVLYFVTTYILESYVFHSTWFHAALRVLRCKRSPSNPYKHVLRDMDPSWPPLGKREVIGEVLTDLPANTSSLFQL
ncbi:hypothetical protein EMCRGX_G017415 [Ephydatia muelleri]